MKKNYIYLVIILLLPLALLAGCGSNKPPSLDERIGGVEEPVSTSYEGTIERLESLDVYQQGTHQLVTTERKTIIIQSPSINLTRYLNEEVLIKGFLQKAMGDAKDVFTVTEISYVDESRSAELVDYENRLYGFRFSRPSTWILKENQGEISLTYEERKLVSMAVFSDKTDLQAFATSQEEGEYTEVTIAAQRAFRYVDASRMAFYVPNPPKNKIYLIEYRANVNVAESPRMAESQLKLFYDLLESFELIYLSQVQGEKCGGLQQIECSEGQICQLDNDGKYAEGICVAINGEANGANCPYIAPPTSCEQYRISEYSQKGCPSRYECVSDAESFDSASFRDLNVVDAGQIPEDFDLSDAKDKLDEDAPTEDAKKMDDEGVDEDLRVYEVPDVSAVTAQYVNERAGFSLVMPKTWYFASFGPIDGALWKVGFSDVELEEPEGALITLSLTKESDSDISKKIDDTHYNFHGPSDLTEIMSEMLGTIETAE